MVQSRNKRSGIDWLSPAVVLVATFSLYVLGRIAIGAWLGLPPIWGGSENDEAKARVLVAIFSVAVAVGVWVVPRHRVIRLDARERGPAGTQVGTFVTVGYLVLGGAACVHLIRQLGGVSEVLARQGEWASQIRERGLGPYYGLTYVYVIGAMVTAFRAQVSGRSVRGILWFLIAIVPAVLLGRRVIILFAGMPLLTYFHYHRVRLGLRHVVLLGLVSLAVFTSILVLRLRTTGGLVETIATSREYAIYDALVAAVSRSSDLEELSPGFYVRHVDDFWRTNTGALFMQRIAGFQFEGGTTPPTAVGTIWVYFGLPGLVVGGLLLGFVLGRCRLEAQSTTVGAVLYGFVLFHWFDFLRDGDIVLGAKLVARYGTVLLLVLLCYYRLRLVPTREKAAHRATAGT